eukprot:scaffold54727_cov50-Attheya_sp.AAC.1
MAATVIDSWKLVTAIDNYEEVAGVILFRKYVSGGSPSSIFAIAPEAHDLFRFAKEFEPNSEELFESARLKKHGAGVVSMLNIAICMLGTDLEPLVLVLKDLGARHAKYGVLEAHFPIVGQALIETLADALGEKFTDDVKAAWVDIYAVVQSNMLAGMKKVDE